MWNLWQSGRKEEATRKGDFLHKDVHREQFALIFLSCSLIPCTATDSLPAAAWQLEDSEARVPLLFFDHLILEVMENFRLNWLAPPVRRGPPSAPRPTRPTPAASASGRCRPAELHMSRHGAPLAFFPSEVAAESTTATSPWLDQCLFAYAAMMSAIPGREATTQACFLSAAYLYSPFQHHEISDTA